MLPIAAMGFDGERATGGAVELVKASFDRAAPMGYLGSGREYLLHGGLLSIGRGVRAPRLFYLLIFRFSWHYLGLSRV